MLFYQLFNQIMCKIKVLYKVATYDIPNDYVYIYMYMLTINL